MEVDRGFRPLPGAFLSCFAKKGSKECDLRGLLALPRETPFPLRIPQARRLRVLPFPHLRKCNAVLEMPNFLKSQMGIPTPPALRPVGGRGERGRDCGCKPYNALPQPTSLVTFLFGTRK